MHTLLSVIDFWVDKVDLDTRITPLNKNNSNDQVIKRFVEPWDSFPNPIPEFFLSHIVRLSSIYFILVILQTVLSFASMTWQYANENGPIVGTFAFVFHFASL